MVIGTHKLLSPEVRFKRLGLIIIDEEQRFGVEHKEYLKRLRTEVDVLSMSATPIPRTLEMGVAGIRQMSTILTPPEERHPVLTFVGPYDERQIAAAVRRELLRDGQVFFVHNRVASINKVAARVSELVPEARVAVAHGQMNEHQLEAIMVDFWDGKFDVLVATTIVESGLDIPNANTLIVDRADTYGLSQLHQLRGRVGRGRERAYAYFLYPPERTLTETAHERLATVAQHTEIGAGMYVALKDLEIRGAGNLLGGEQSGHIAGVGFDLYVRMIGEAVNELKGDGPADRPEVRVELPVNAHIPHDYLPGERLRLEAYTRIAAIDSDADVTAVRDELTDRYGQLPEPVLNLLEVARLRARARHVGPDRYHPAGQPCPVRAGRAARIEAGPGAAAVPQDTAQAGSAYDAGAGSQGGARVVVGRGVPGPVSGQLGHRHRRPAAAGPGHARLVRRTHRGCVRRAGAASRNQGVRRDLAVRRTPIRTATAVKAAVAAAAFGGLIAGCAPVQMGAAATVGNDSISTSQLNSEVANLTTAAKPYSSAVHLTDAQKPKDVLGWLIRFKVRDALAAKENINITASQREQALESIYEQAAQQAQQQGVSNVTLPSWPWPTACRRTCWTSWASTRPWRSPTPSGPTAASCRPRRPA